MRKSAGFTLVEVMTAATVLVLIFMSSISAITMGFRLLEDARMTTLASQVLQSEMEDLRLMNWSELNALSASEEFPIQSSINNASFEKFTRLRTIETVSGNSNMKRVTVSVTWQTTNGQNRSRQYVTQIAKDGINDYYYRSF